MDGLLQIHLLDNVDDDLLDHIAADLAQVQVILLVGFLGIRFLLCALLFGRGLLFPGLLFRADITFLTNLESDRPSILLGFVRTTDCLIGSAVRTDYSAHAVLAFDDVPLLLRQRAGPILPQPDRRRQPQPPA